MNLSAENNSHKAKVLHFEVQDVRMCIYLENIDKVLPLVELQVVPGSPNYLAGLMNFHGQSIPIIDLGIRTGLVRSTSYSINVAVLLCHTNENKNKVGFIVDKITGLSRIENSSIQMLDKVEKENLFFLGTVIDNLDSSLLINITYLLNDTQSERSKI